MAKKPTKSSGSRILNIMGLARGNFDFKTSVGNSETLAFGSPEVISLSDRTKLLSRMVSGGEGRTPTRVDASSILGVVQSSLSKVGNDRMENRKILQIMPEVDKAARLMIASTFSPNDLTNQKIVVKFDTPEAIDSLGEKLSEFATDFFQEKLNLKTAAAKWVYQFGYETGASVFAIIPLRTFERIEDASYLGMENFISKVIDPVATEAIFGFGDNRSGVNDTTGEILGLESFGKAAMTALAEEVGGIKTDPSNSSAMRNLVEKFIGHEALNLTDNPSILQLHETAKKKVKSRTKSVLNTKFRNQGSIQQEPILSIDASEDTEVMGDPILMRLPPEAVTVIHTPGDPNDHQGYLVLLDRQGNPINAVAMEQSKTSSSMGMHGGNNQNSIFNQVYTAYGLHSSSGSINKDVMHRLYNQIISQHIHKRIDKAGFTNVTLGNSDAMFRCMFSRFLQDKQTRVLFLPKELVTYMAFELDEEGYGVSRLERIKFALGMKMAVQVSRTLATIKAAMDRRRIEVKFSDNLMEHPETIMQTVVNEYLKKSTMSFSTDPNVIQNQIADKSLSIKGIDIPGFEQFDLSNEPDSRSSSFDFDPKIEESLDKQINNGLHVPPSAMNSLGEDEYARSITTTNLFFAMDVALDQDIVKQHISDLIRKYARFSQSFLSGICKVAPGFETGNDNTSIDKTAVSKSDGEVVIPKGYDIDALIDSMSISLPHPNVAPSKAQFEALNAMIESIGGMVDALFPDDLVGQNDTLLPVVRLLRAKFKSTNIRNYLERSGMSGVSIPDTNFTEFLADTGTLIDGLQNFSAMLKDKAKLDEPKEEETPAF